ncbi:sensor histidine kinase [Halobacillus halophilus]|uniref:sensor histidine kinase n=1 Tax=Halobacillus halophilus TaxID=1570 RepID=UPI001CD78ADB|nr:sensor histidine kinase [Halobacillus halophilus]MCA1011445.1 sensor histidine kinase [Halobacillus halophilus]
MKKLLRVSLQIKILGLVTVLLLLVLSLATFMFTSMESNEDVENAEDLALQTSKTLSYMPVIQEAFRVGQSTENMNHIVAQVKDEVGASAVKIVNRQRELYSYAGVEWNGEIVKEDYYRSLVFGSRYILHKDQDEPQTLKAIAPILVDYGDYKKVEGAVAVEFQMKSIYDEIKKDIRKIVYASASVFLLGIGGSYLLARSIRKDTLGLEPFEISALFRERNAIVQSVKEGLIAFDHLGKITMINLSARSLLNLQGDLRGQTIHHVIHSPELLNMLDSDKGLINKELQYKDKIVIVNSNPIIEEGSRTGTVVSLRDKTEVKEMVDALSDVRQYSEDLRAQAHEFTSKLYVIMGLIQLEKYEDAIHLIKDEAHSQNQVSEVFFKDILDEKVQAILLGKFAKASEKKIDFQIEEGSSLGQLPSHIPLSPLIIILGNLINNAFEAVAEENKKRVTFFVTDLGKDIVFEIEDTGKGMEQEEMKRIFDKGYSSKGDNRGYGLANVKEEIEKLDGSIEISSDGDKGTVITVILPKKFERGM